MGKLLGLKKTDRYWLVHKNYFKTEVIMGKMRVEVESFEKWYANQIKYRKVTGEEPGLELKKRSLSIKDIAQMLEIHETSVYELIKKENMETVTVDYWKRVPVNVFWNWYNNQTRYRTQEDRLRDKELEEATLSMPEMARKLGVPRSTIYHIIGNERYKSFFELVMIGEQKRYKKDGFEKFLESQNVYRLAPVDNKTIDKDKVSPETDVIEDSRFTKVRKNSEETNEAFFTLAEAAAYAGVSRNTISAWCRKKYFPSTKQGKFLRIPTNEFKHWLKHR